MLAKPTPAPTVAAGTDAPPAESDLTGKTLGDFLLLRRLGRGGMGQVYVAEQLSLKRKVAIKVMRAELAANETALKRFKVEAEAVARITHANIVQVYAIGECDGLHYMALEYVDGRNLGEFLARKGPPELLMALSIMRQVAAALQRASEQGIIHRDIKPDNILLTRKGEVKVADFGLARLTAEEQQPVQLTASGVTLGTPLYMSPEQVQCKPVDVRSDIYSFGVTCYHMLAGQPPFRGDNAFNVALQHVQATPEPLAQVRPDLPAELCAVVDKMMAKDPQQRYQTCRELLKDLARLREGLTGGRASVVLRMVPGPSASQPLPAMPPTVVLPRWPAKRWLPWLAAASILLSLGVGVVLGLVATGRLGSERHPPAAEAPPPSQPLAQEGAAFDLKKREQALEEVAKQHSNPVVERGGAMVRGLDARVELGLFYLDQGRGEDADRYFLSLIDNPNKVKCYTVLGRIGHAIVLASRDQPKESYAALLECCKKGDKGCMIWVLTGHPRLCEKASRAVQRNIDNREPVPKELEPLARIPPAGPPWTGSAKPVKK
jgi:serine/threonine-protein kinase